MGLIERYIFKKATIATVAILVSLAGVVWIVQALGKLDVITTKGQSLVSYFMLTTLVIPMLFLAVIPVALLLGTVATVNQLNQNSELVVINTSGASNRIVAKPFIILALLVSIFTGFVGHFVIAWSLTTLKEYRRDLAADLVSVIIREGTFNEIEKGLTFHVAKRLPNGELGGILIADVRDENNEQTFIARSGVLTRTDDAAVLRLSDGEIIQREGPNGNQSIIRFDSYAFDLNTLSAQDSSFNRRPKERTTPELLFPDPNDKYLKQQPALYTSEIHQRFSEMLWPFAYVMVILAFCGQARSSRQGYGSAIASGMILLLVLRGIAFSAASGIKANETLAIVLYVVPLLAIAFAGYFLVTNQLVGIPKSMQPAWNALGRRVQELHETNRERYLMWRRRLAGVRT